jgi:hypothetical protein
VRYPLATLLPYTSGRQLALIVLTRDKRIRTRPVERDALLDHDVRACFLTSGGNLDLFTQLRLSLRHWDDIETPADTTGGPWLASVTKNNVRVFAGRSTR